MTHALGKRGLMHMRKVASQVSLCSPQRLIKGVSRNFRSKQSSFKRKHKNIKADSVIWNNNYSYSFSPAFPGAQLKFKGVYEARRLTVYAKLSESLNTNLNLIKKRRSFTVAILLTKL